MIKFVLDKLLDGDSYLKIYLDEAGLDLLRKRLDLLSLGGGSVHLAGLVDTSPTPSGNPTISDIDIVLNRGPRL